MLFQPLTGKIKCSDGRGDIRNHNGPLMLREAKEPIAGSLQSPEQLYDEQEKKNNREDRRQDVLPVNAKGVNNGNPPIMPIAPTPGHRRSPWEMPHVTRLLADIAEAAKAGRHTRLVEQLRMILP
jgi:hypothetical protein